MEVDTPRYLEICLTSSSSRSVIKFALLILILFILFWLPSVSPTAWAQEETSQDKPHPATLGEDVTPMDKAFQEKPQHKKIFPWLKEQLTGAPPFFRDTKLDLNLRTYYLFRDKFDDTKSEAWAAGGSLAYQSGLFLERLGIGAALYTSQPIYAPDDRDGTGLLKPGQKGYTVVGQLYGRVKLAEENFITLYRHEYNTPFINRNDSRMSPNTFEGYTFQGATGGRDDTSKLVYGVGYIDKIKPQNSDRFIPMSEAAGADVKRGVVAGGVNVSFGGFSIGAIDYYSEDILNIGYAEAKYTWPLTSKIDLLFAAQFTDQRSVGKDLLKGYSFKTNQFGVKTDVSYGGAILTLGYTRDSKGADLQSPWGSYPGYTSVQVQDFNRAKEEALLVKAAYDFTRLGLEGVTAYGLFVHGWGRVDSSTKDPVPDENEFNVDLQWRPQWSFLKGIWLRTRYAVVHQYEGPKRYTHDFRVILNYDFSLL